MGYKVVFPILIKEVLIRGMCGDESTSFMPPENRYSIVGIGVNSKTEAYRSYYKDTKIGSHII